MHSAPPSFRPATRMPLLGGPRRSPLIDNPGNPPGLSRGSSTEPPARTAVPEEGRPGGAGETGLICRRDA